MGKGFALLFVILLLSVMTLGTVIVLPVKAESQAGSLMNEALSFMENVFGYNMSMYNLTLTDNYQIFPGQPLYNGPTSRWVAFNLTSADGNAIQVWCDFLNGSPLTISMHTLGRSVFSPHYLQPLPKTVSGKPFAFLDRYQNFTHSAYIQPLLDMLSQASISQGPNSNLTLTQNNIKMQYEINNEISSEISWTYSYNGISFSPKSVAISFDKNGNPQSFKDFWNLYTIGSTAVNISMEQAANLAWRMASNISSVDIIGLGTLPLYWFNNAIVFLDGGVRDNYTEYLYYDVYLATNLTYNNGYGGFEAEVMVWADNGEAKVVNQGNVLMYQDQSLGTKIQPNPVSSISGNITSSQMSLVAVSDNQATQVTELSFNVTGQAGTIGFSNLTITKNTLSYGEIPFVFTDDKEAQNQGYTQDSNNYYVWYTTEFSTHQVSMVFSSSTHPSPVSSQNDSFNLSKPFPTMTDVAISGAVATVVAVAGLLVYFKKRKR